MAVSLLYEFIAFEIKTKFSLSPSNSRKRESWDETARLDGVQKVGGIIIFFRRLWGNIHTLLTLTHIHRVHNLLFYSFKYNFVLSAIHTPLETKDHSFLCIFQKGEREYGNCQWFVGFWKSKKISTILWYCALFSQGPRSPSSCSEVSQFFILKNKTLIANPCRNERTNNSQNATK